MSKSVVYSSCSRISCASSESPDVVLCLDSDTLLASGRTTIPGVLTKVYKVSDNCDKGYWRYVVSYDETLLTNPAVALTSDQIEGIFCKGCLTDWVVDEINAAAAELLTVTDTESIDLTISPTSPQTLSADVNVSADVGNIVEIRADGLYATAAGGGGACFEEVTTAEFNALVAGNDLTPGCTYVITDHVQGRLVAGTQIYLTALTTNQVASACSVLSTYDTEFWRGVYDVANNILVELTDNQGNTAKQYPVAVGNSLYDSVNNFDWGNPDITNCHIANALWQLDYGITGFFDRIIMEAGSTLNMVGYSGDYLQSVTIGTYYDVTLTGTMEMEDVIFRCAVFGGGAGSSSFTDNNPDNFLFSVYLNGGSLDIGPDVEVYVEATTLDNYATIRVQDSGGLYVVSSHLSSESLLICNGVNTALSNFIESTIGASSTVSFTSITSPGTGYIEKSAITANGTLNVTGSSLVLYVNVSQGTLNTDGFDLTNVYVLGNTTTTCTANNVNTGRDYFNNSII